METNKKRKKEKINLNVFLPRLSRLKLPHTDKQTVMTILTEQADYVFNSCFCCSKGVISIIMKKEIEVIAGIPLSAEEEKTLFLQLNYVKHKMYQTRRKILRQPKWTEKIIQELLEWNLKRLKIRSKIVTANMGLVLSMAQQTKFIDVEFTDLISEGNMALLRASEKFDCSRGVKFSTYACRAIIRALSKIARQNYRYQSGFTNQLDVLSHIEDEQEKIHAEYTEWIDEVRFIVQNNLAYLSDLEKKVIELRFGFNGEFKFLTLKQIGEKMGLTKERIRQIQNNALTKLRIVAKKRLVVV